MRGRIDQESLEFAHFLVVLLHLHIETMINLILAQASSETAMGIEWWGAIKDVTNPFALLAFIAFASVTALLGLLRSTSGLAVAQEYLLKNAQLTGAQVERIFFFTLLVVASVTVVLFVHLFTPAGNIDQASLATASAPNVDIVSPMENATVEVSKGFSPYTLKGQSSDIPEDEEVWVVSHPLESSRFFPFHSQAAVEADGDWSSTGTIGPIEKENTKYEFLVIGADENARYVIREYLKNSDPQKGFSGFDSIPNSWDIYAKREVTFVPKGE